MILLICGHCKSPNINKVDEDSCWCTNCKAISMDEELLMLEIDSKPEEV